MLIDYILVGASGITLFVQAFLGLIVTTRPPSKDRRAFYEIAFGVLGVLGMSCVIWSGVRTIQSSSHEDRKLGQIQSGQTQANAQLARIASILDLDPNQSAQVLADKVIAAIGSFQQQLSKTQAGLSALQNPPPDPKNFYQNGSIVASIMQEPTLFPDGSFLFEGLSGAGGIDFSRTINFRNYILVCDQHPLNTMFDGGTGKTQEMFDVTCRAVQH